MHSFFGIKPGGSAHDMVQPPSNLSSLARRHDGVEVVVIDEISMAGPLRLVAWNFIYKDAVVHIVSSFGIGEFVEPCPTTIAAAKK